jgi:hypothetical protein
MALWSFNFDMSDSTKWEEVKEMGRDVTVG